MNSTYNVSSATRRMLKRELHRGFELTESIGHRLFTTEDFKRLIAVSEIFLEHRDFLQICAYAKNKDQLHKWLGWVEAKIRLLIKNVDSIPNCEAYPVPKHFPLPPRTVEVPSPAPEKNGAVEQRTEVGECFFIGLNFDLAPAGNGPRSVDLSSQVSYFIFIVNEYAFREEGMRIEIHHMRSNSLPDIVFGDERRPEKKKSKKKSRKKSRVREMAEPDEDCKKVKTDGTSPKTAADRAGSDQPMTPTESALEDAREAQPTDSPASNDGLTPSSAAATSNITGNGAAPSILVNVAVPILTPAKEEPELTTLNSDFVGQSVTTAAVL